MGRINGLSRADREGPMQELLYAGDPIWQAPGRIVFDPKETAWIEEDDVAALRKFQSGASPRSSEAVRVSYPDPQEVVLEAELQSPGLIVLADVYYPGWTLTIDGQEAPMYRVNRLMRGAAVEAGTHRLVYSYRRPPSFVVGGWISISGLSILALLAIGFLVRPGAAFVNGGEPREAAPRPTAANGPENAPLELT
jgi:hypothetical protein